MARNRNRLVQVKEIRMLVQECVRRRRRRRRIRETHMQEIRMLD